MIKLKIYDVISGFAIVALLSFIHGATLENYQVTSNREESLVFAVKLNIEIGNVETAEIDVIANRVASDCELISLGQIGALKGYYLFRSIIPSKNSTFANSKSKSNQRAEKIKRLRRHLEQSISSHEHVEWQEIQVELKRSQRSRIPSNHQRSLIKRSAVSSSGVTFNDPFFPKQWHLLNVRNPGADINVTGVWNHGVTGHGVTVAVIDDGLEWNNADIIDNYNPEASFDLNDSDNDPMPSGSKASNHHGTRCAGEIAAVANNSVCGVGVAYRAKVAGIRILDGRVTDALEAAAFTKRIELTDVYSCSWGPQDDGMTVDGPQRLAVASMEHGINYGRHGYGSIYVVASGNGGRVGDNCNYDGYANSIYTVTIGAVDESGRMPYYSEECASMLAVAYSSGSNTNDRDIVTTDWTLGGATGCTEGHSGTSAAAPLAAAMIALMLEVRPCLTWRDVQYIIVLSAVMLSEISPETKRCRAKQAQDESHVGWTHNSAGLNHSHQHGFGLMNAWRLVNTAKVWRSLPWLTMYSTSDLNTTDNLGVPTNGVLQVTVNITDSDLEGYSLNTLEYVHVTLSLTHERRGDLMITLISPHNTLSIIGAKRDADNSTSGFTGWTFSTVRCWGEDPRGVWTLTVSDQSKKPLVRSRGVLKSWKLTLYGSHMTSADVQDRLRLVEEASSGKFLNDSFELPCDPPPVKTLPATRLSEKVLKVLLLTGAFAIFIAVYQTLEFIFCYDEEKREQESQRKTSRSDSTEVTRETRETDHQVTRNGYARLEQDDYELTRIDTSQGLARLDEGQELTRLDSSRELARLDVDQGLEEGRVNETFIDDLTDERLNLINHDLDMISASSNDLNMISIGNNELDLSREENNDLNRIDDLSSAGDRGSDQDKFLGNLDFEDKFVDLLDASNAGACDNSNVIEEQSLLSHMNNTHINDYNAGQ